MKKGTCLFTSVGQWLRGAAKAKISDRGGGREKRRSAVDQSYEQPREQSEAAKAGGEELMSNFNFLFSFIIFDLSRKVEFQILF